MNTFTKGNTSIILSQENVANAIEWWLNETVLKEKCKVVGLTDIVKGSHFYEFEIKLANIEEVKDHE